MKNEPLNDWRLERFILRELPRREMNAICRRMLTETSVRDRISRLRRSDGDILCSYPAEKMVPQIEKKLASKKIPFREKSLSRQRKFVKLAWVPAVLGLFIGIYLVTRQISDRPTPLSPQGSDWPSARLKGVTSIDAATAGLHIFRQDKEAVEELRDESSTATNDLIQLAYTAGSFDYGIIFSIDGRGTVTLHFPDDSGQSPLLQKGKLIFLQKAYKLDDAPDFERFFFIGSKNEIDVSAILKKAHQWSIHPRQVGAGLFVIPNLQQISVLLRKR